MISTASRSYAARLKEEMYKIRGIVDLAVTLEHDIPEYRLQVDRERRSHAGVTHQRCRRTVGALVGGEAVSTYEDEDGDAVDVRVRLPDSLRQNPDQVKNLKLAVWRGRGSGPVLAAAREHRDV